MPRPTNKGLVSKQNLVNIGNAIRTKTGETAPIALTDMPSKILALGTAENPLIATSDSEMATYLADADKSGMFVQFNGTSTTYVNGEVYRIMDSGDTTQYVPTTDIKVEQEKSITITENGSTSVIPDIGKTLSKVNITTNVPQSSINKGIVFSNFNEEQYPTEVSLINITAIPDKFFYGLFNNGIGIIGSYITNISILEGITKIGYGSFSNCTGLTNVSLPNSLTLIDSEAFYGCEFTTLTIPANVSTIGGLALPIGTPTNKATITMKGLFPPTIESDTFKASYLNKIYVPSGSVTQYKNATNWANFADYIEADPNE